MTNHKTGTRADWLAARLRLLDAEKAHLRRGDEIARMRQELPWVPIEKEYVFDTEEGPKSLTELSTVALSSSSTTSCSATDTG